VTGIRQSVRTFPKSADGIEKSCLTDNRSFQASLMRLVYGDVREDYIVSHQIDYRPPYRRFSEIFDFRNLQQADK